MSNTEQISISATNGSGTWNPIIGEETQTLLDHLKLPTESRQTLANETIEILSQCGNPSNPTNADVGLVFGYVQSGKTMSFTTLTALAKDNGYRIIIVIAGISTNLVEQSFTRLEKDLRIDTRHDLQWLSFKNPKPNDFTTRNQINAALESWRDDTFPEDARQTILITVMKQKNHLSNLQTLLQSIDTNNVPTLIIDDEGDQHSMNGRARQNARTGQEEMTTIHRRVVELKNDLPHHTFIQYTATPQAPLFADLMNNLSPNFIQLLTPGPDYTGGKTFFVENPNIVKVISDLDTEDDLTNPPASLIYALQIFFIGVVKGRMAGNEGKRRSMMIHPSQFTFTHSDYFRFVTAIKTRFIATLSLPDNSPDKNDLLDEFKIAYDDLATTTSDLPPFEVLITRLKQYISLTVIQSLNSQRGNKTSVEWRNSYSFILIGGQAMDRGFTVEGLTVTYMPRTVGVRNADTIQQRARFFGYKNSYLGYCRVYLDQDARGLYIDYVEHEEDMRRRLSENKNSGNTLNEWYREVFLSSGLNLARPSVFSTELARTILGSEWISPKVPHQPNSAVLNNQNIVKLFFESNTFDTSGRYPVLNLRLATVYDELLNQLKFPNEKDFGDYNAILYVLNRHLEEYPDETCTVFIMSDFESQRERSLSDRNEINQLFQGRNAHYEGDRAILGPGITFQIHIVNLLINKTVVHEDIPVLATFIPEALGQELIHWA